MTDAMGREVQAVEIIPYEAMQRLKVHVNVMFRPATHTANTPWSRAWKTAWPAAGLHLRNM